MVRQLEHKDANWFIPDSPTDTHIIIALLMDVRDAFVINNELLRGIKRLLDPAEVEKQRAWTAMLARVAAIGVDFDLKVHRAFKPMASAAREQSAVARLANAAWRAACSKAYWEEGVMKRYMQIVDPLSLDIGELLSTAPASVRLLEAMKARLDK